MFPPVEGNGADTSFDTSFNFGFDFGPSEEVSTIAAENAVTPEVPRLRMFRSIRLRRWC